MSHLQNRDRLELYALHKQAVSGDAPSTFSSSASPADKAKYQAWKSKLGLSRIESMRLYLSEADRQIRVYGNLTPQTPQATPSTSNGNPNGAPINMMDTPRGLAAIPLLCAAAAESRPAYLRRLAQTPYENAWWKRQESLCGTPGTVTALPEMAVLQLARFVEHLSLSRQGPPNAVLQSFLWPLHNSLLALWMMLILVLTLMESVWNILQIVVWGARRTGLSLTRVWDHDLRLWEQCQVNMCETHQATTCRLVGLFLLPVSFVLRNLKRFVGSMTLASTLFGAMAMMTWWYFVFVLPWLAFIVLGTACSSGACFALIQVAGV